MIDFFSNIHIRLQRRIGKMPAATTWDKIHIRFYVALDYLCVWCANLILPAYFRIKGSESIAEKTLATKSNKVIVSLTTFPKRIGKVWMVVESLLRQSKKPDEIHLWLSKEQITGEAELPKSLKREIKKGLKVHFVEGDIRSHKKYFYILQSNPEDLIVSVDDDLLYKSDTISKLLQYHEKYPNCVIACYARKIETINGELLPYDTWKQYDEEGVNGRMFFGSGGGTLFPPHILYKNVTKLDAILACCPTADDIWLNAMTRLNGKRIIKTDSSKIILPVLNRDNITLSDNENAGGDGNDRQIKLVRDYIVKEYGVDPFGMERL